ncbi:hypothetical protein [Mycolicibacterium frederiksbergense]|uniref:hypothetical protein n=1 Tax=Mycolicibacterium frederiksbergense TaxID=117567 RepID=UPI00399C30B5
MPDDLLGGLIGPTPYSSIWLWLAVALAVLTVLWYIGVFWWTGPGRTHSEPSVIGSARAALQRRRALRAIQAIQNQYRTGELTATAAAAALGEHVRRFLRDTTGVRAEYVQVPDMAAVSGGVLAPAAPVLADLEDAQFNAGSGVDIGATGQAAEELVRQWT